MSKGYQGYFMAPNKRYHVLSSQKSGHMGVIQVKYTVQSARNLLRFSGSENGSRARDSDNTWP